MDRINASINLTLLVSEKTVLKKGEEK